MRSAEKSSRLRGATVTDGLCPYCAVGCSQLIYTKAGQLIDTRLVLWIVVADPAQLQIHCLEGADHFQSMQGAQRSQSQFRIRVVVGFFLQQRNGQGIVQQQLSDLCGGVAKDR